MSRWRRRPAAIAALLALPVLAACGARERATIPPGPVTIGVVTPIVDPEAEALGAAVRQGAELALEELDAAPVRLVFADAGSGPQASAAALRELAGDGARAVIAAVEPGRAEALIAAAREAGVALVIPESGDGDAGDDVFRLGPATGRGSHLLEELLAAQPDWRRLALACAPGSEAEAVARVLTAAAEATGRLIVDAEPAEPANPAEPAEPAEPAGADVTVVCGDAAAVVAGVARAAAAAPGRPLLALVAGDDPMLFDPDARAAVGLELATAPGREDEPVAALDRFARRYAERHGATADAWAAFGHDAVALLARAAAASDGSGAGIAEALRALGPVAGAYGVTRIGADGTARSALQLTAPLDEQGTRRVAVWPVGTGLPAPARIRVAAHDGAETTPDPATLDTDTAAGTGSDPGAPLPAPPPAPPSAALPAPAETRGPLVALYDFQGADRPLAQAVAENLRAEGWNVRLAPATASGALPRLGSAHLYRREETSEALDAAAAIAIAAGMDVRMHPWMETGQEDIRQLLRDDDQADFVIVLN